MSDIQTKITMCEIALSKLVQSDANVRKTFTKEGFAELAASIAAHGLMQNLTVRPETGLDGAPTGRYEVLAGGRRLAALTRLARQKRVARDALIPCNVREDGHAEELSLAENVAREPLHPADQFEAFHDLHVNKAMAIADIAARFGVSERIVNERLKLANVSPKLLSLYRQGDMGLDQLMAFTVSDDHARQEAVWEQLSWNRNPNTIRACLLETHIRADDKRAIFAGLEAYRAAGGTLIRDLFAEDDGGYLADPVLLDRIVLEKLEAIAEAVRTEGWKWVETAIDLPHGHGFARIYPHDVALPETDAERQTAIETELESLEAAFEEEGGEQSGDSERYRALVAEYESLDAKGRMFDPADMARCGAFVGLAPDGHAQTLRGFLRPEDDVSEGASGGRSDNVQPDNAEDSAPKLSAALIADLTAHRTAGLRDAVGRQPELALTACVHALTLSLFYHGASVQSCLDIAAGSRDLDGLASAVADSPAAIALAARHADWAAQMPAEPHDLWAFVRGLNQEQQLALLAHCISLTIDAVETVLPTSQKLAHADLLAEVSGLDMRKTWTATAANYLGRVPKHLIIEAVREGCGPRPANRIAALKKPAMAQAAEDLLKDSGWLPKLLRPRAVNNPDSNAQEITAEAAE